MKLTMIANGIESKPVEVTVDKAPTAKIPINEAVVAHLIGSLADGPLCGSSGRTAPCPSIRGDRPWSGGHTRSGSRSWTLSRLCGRWGWRLPSSVRNSFGRAPIQNLEPTLKDHSGGAKYNTAEEG